VAVFVAITGGTSSGKTTLARGLSRRFGDELAVLAFDDLAIGRAALAAAGRVVTDWDDPALWRWDDVRRHVADLRAGRATTVDARSRESRAAGIASRRIEPRPVVALVGFLALHDETLARAFDARVYLDLPEDEMVRRRLRRPPSEENREPYLSSTLLPAHRRLVVPQRDRATHVVDGMLTRDTVADEVADIIRRCRRSR
jgi:uridine kinase